MYPLLRTDDLWRMCDWGQAAAVRFLEAALDYVGNFGLLSRKKGYFLVSTSAIFSLSPSQECFGVTFPCGVIFDPDFCRGIPEGVCS